MPLQIAGGTLSIYKVGDIYKRHHGKVWAQAYIFGILSLIVLAAMQACYSPNNNVPQAAVYTQHYLPSGKKQVCV